MSRNHSIAISAYADYGHRNGLQALQQLITYIRNPHKKMLAQTAYARITGTKPKEIIPCICMTCGIRNDLKKPQENGHCKNGHDNWLEYRDVMGIDDGEYNFQYVQETANRFGLSIEQLTTKFLDTRIKQL